MRAAMHTLICLLGVWAAPLLAQAGLLEHNISVELDPAKHRLQVRDQITLPDAFPQSVTFLLHRGLEPSTPDPEVRIQPLPVNSDSTWAAYRLERVTDSKRVTIDYTGKIHHPLQGLGQEQSRGFGNTPGLISEEGVYLSGSSYWYPQFRADNRLSFKLDVRMPAGWQAVSQGRQDDTVGDIPATEGSAVSRWHSATPQEEIYLIVAPFIDYRRALGRVEAQVFLRTPDPGLAAKYLDATEKYLAMYEALLGEYPYAKFALVENFWETGFGMPSFTLLGSKVIRLPFILNSSYPHEILHNWWGNGVYVDYSGGNWSEGLTAYLADHLIREQQGQAVPYRQQALQKYSDYAASSRDFALSQFTGRHSSASEAVGYGKSLMLMHMLRQELGDPLFVQALQQFYKTHRFHTASFADLKQAFEQASGKRLDDRFDQWVERSGAPALELTDTRIDTCGDRSCLHFTLRQIQPGEAYRLAVPVAITLEGREQARQELLRMEHKQQDYTLELNAAPLRLDIDSEFDLFRRLALEETPPAFTQLFGASELLVLLPADAPPGMKAAWQAFAADLARMGPEQVKTAWDKELESLPDDLAVVVLGWENRFAHRIVDALEEYDARIDGEGLAAEGEAVPRSGHAVAVTTRHKTLTRAFIAADLAAALPGLGRKLPHYHKYSYLAFSGEEPENVMKGRWAVLNSPMTELFVANAKMGKRAARAPLVLPPVEYDTDRMRETIAALTDPALQGRGFGSQGLDRAAEYISRAFAEAGLEPGGDTKDSYFQNWRERGGSPEREADLRNVIGILPGSNPGHSGSVVIGAHYDHLGLGWPDVRGDNQGVTHPGADDNASGVAVLLELARVLRDKFQVERDIVFIAFGAEEAGRLGSIHYLESLEGKSPFAMLNMDTVGRLEEGKLLVLGADSAREWVHIFRGIGFVTGIQTTMVKEPLDASDQISFHEAGIPAVQLFSGANTDYHRPTDSVDKIDIQGLVKVAKVAKEVIEYLGARQAPLSIQLNDNPGSRESERKQGSRRVSLGSVPDFSYQGKGYRLDGVVSGSPADSAGLQHGDIIVKLNQYHVAGLKEVSEILKQLQPGQMLSIGYHRDGIENTVRVKLINR